MRREKDSFKKVTWRIWREMHGNPSIRSARQFLFEYRQSYEERDREYPDQPVVFCITLKSRDPE